MSKITNDGVTQSRTVRFIAAAYPCGNSGRQTVKGLLCQETYRTFYRVVRVHGTHSNNNTDDDKPQCRCDEHRQWPWWSGCKYCEFPSLTDELLSRCRSQGQY